MPVERDNIISTASEQWRPTMTNDGQGNIVPDPSHETRVTACVSGVIPQSIRHDPYRQIGGGTVNEQKWLVVVRGVADLRAGDSIHVLQGKFIGRYRCEIVQIVPNETLILAQCLREA